MTVKIPCRRKCILFFMVLLSGMVSAYDNTLSWLTADWIAVTEQNIFCSWIIEHWGVGRLIELKAAGTIVACCIMLELIYTKYWSAIVVVFAVQVVLFFYLTCYPLDGHWKDLFAPLRWAINFYVEIFKNN